MESWCCGLTLLCLYLAKTWPAWLDVSKKACGVCGHASKINHKSKGCCPVPEHVNVYVDANADLLLQLKFGVKKVVKG